MTVDTLIGQTLGKYKVTEHLGRGGMAEVYKGYREDLDRTVAIKLMHSFLSAEEDFLFRFKREARAMAQMRHPNIVSVYDFDVFGENTYYLVMEYIGGGTLKDTLTKLARNGERLPLEHSVRIALEVADALTYAHGRDMVHRDIKPANIMLTVNGKAILTDFGIVKLVGGQSMAYTATGALIGTPAYMSPEQALGKPGDARSDLYSLGILLFQMVTGQLPFSADTPLAVVMKHVNDPVPLPVAFNPDVPKGLQETILKALAKEPENRFQTAAEMAQALRAVDLGQAPAEAEAVAAPTTAPERHDTPTSRTSVSSTAIAGMADLDIAATEVASPMTEVSRTVTAPSPPVFEKKRSPWIFVGGGLILLLAAAGILFASGVIPGGEKEPTATPPVVAIAAQETDTPEPTDVKESPTATRAPMDTPDVVASSVAAIAQTAAALATDTPTVTSTPTRRPTSTPTSTPTLTPDLTALFLESCITDVELVSAYTYRASTNSAPVSVNFPMNWVLKNSGTCPWPDGLAWAYQAGEEFGYDDPPIALTGAVVADEEITLETTFSAPARSGTYESTWQLIDADGEPFGPTIAFDVFVYIPFTPTPVASPTPVATPTAATVNLQWAYDIRFCEHTGTIEWRCQYEIIPYGGVGPYTVWWRDGTEAVYRTPPYQHWIVARRCAAFNDDFDLVDEGSGSFINVQIYIDPSDHFACVPVP